ncbi:MAG TPA: succinyl-diaminopimelate desuccinylase [Burkholderiaceae bacterium]|nr:succinyl-diaminopimelate desuccinylase [Burkholderiaceae bacterium]
MSTVLQLVSELIRRPSVTPQDGGCQRMLADRLRRIGFRAESQDRGSTLNTWMIRGSARPLLVFAGHTDVVPPGPGSQWRSDPFEPSLRDGYLYGRGAADMKSSIAAFVVACERFVELHPHHAGSIALLLTSDEEGPATDGTVAVVEALRARGAELDFCIVGEPTSEKQLGDVIKNGRRGSLSGRLVVRGIQGHVAYPQWARNPVHELAPAMAELAAETWDHGDVYFPPTTFQVSNIRAGEGALNVIPGRCEVDFNLRFSPASTARDLMARIEGILARHGLAYEIAWTVGAEPFLTRPGPLVTAMSAAIREAVGCETALSTVGGTSDGRFLATLCPQVVEFGPVNATIHKVDECIRVDDLEPLMLVYLGVLRRLLT